MIMNLKSPRPPLILGGLFFTQNYIYGYQYHYTAKTHVEAVILIDKLSAFILKGAGFIS